MNAPPRTARRIQQRPSAAGARPDLPRLQVGPLQIAWLNEIAQEERDTADALGITETAYHLLAAGRTTSQVTTKLSKAGALDSIPAEQRHSLILMTCATLGIPLRDGPDGESDFRAWQQQHLFSFIGR